MNHNQDTRDLSTRTPQHNTLTTLEWADIVIIGNGIAGLTAAMAARCQDRDKRIVIMTDQPHPTINTPALKQFSINKLKREQLLAYPPGTERSLNIHVIHAHVEKIHAESKYLDLAGNRAFGYGKLLIATGSQPVGLPAEMPGRTFDGVMTLHRLKDYLDLRRRLPEVREAVVIGGGTHANEVVMSLLHWGIRVHWLIRSEKFLPHILDDTASEMVLDKVRRAGAIIRTETEVTAIIGQVTSVAGVITNTKKMIPCQLVVACTGTHPTEGLATQCTKPMVFNNGILVDGTLHTSVQDIYAAGDVAALLDPQTGEYKTRAQWYSAATQGRIAGAMMVGNSEIIAKELFGVPWHATHLGKLSLLTVGDPLGAGENMQMAVHTDISRGGYRRLTIVEDRLVGYLSIGATQPDGLSIKRLIDEGLSVRAVLKPLLKGKFDAHGYITRIKASTARDMITQPLSTLGERWSETDALDLPSIPMLPVKRQIGEIGPAMQTQQVSEAPAGWKPLVDATHEAPAGWKPLVDATHDRSEAMTRHAIRGQFIKPGFIDSRYNRHKNLAEIALAYEQLVSADRACPCPPSSGSRKDIDPRRLPTGEVYTPNPNNSSGNALGPDRETDPLSVRVRENRLHALALHAEDAALPV